MASMITHMARTIIYGTERNSEMARRKPTVGALLWGMVENSARRRIGLHEISTVGITDYVIHRAAEWIATWNSKPDDVSLPDGWPVSLFTVLDNMVRARGGSLKLADDVTVPCFTLDRRSAIVLPNMYIAYVNFENDGCDFAKLEKVEEAMEDAIARKLGQQINLRVLTKPARIEIDRKDAPTVYLSDLWPRYINGTTKAGRYLIGVESKIDGQVVGHGVLDDPNAFSLACFGASGSGKTQALLAATLTAAACTSPSELSIVCIDPKAIDFQIAGLPHLACDIITDAVEARNAILQVVAEMDRRVSAKDMSAQHRRILILIDELGDLLQVQDGDELEKALVRIGQKGRAWGISMFAGSQRGVNMFFPRSVHTQIPLYWVGAVASKQEAGFASGVDGCDAHKLPGRGAAMVYERGGTYTRLQSAFVADSRNNDYRQQVQWFVDSIRERWSGKSPHWTMSGDAGSASAIDDEVDATVDFALVDSFDDALLHEWRQAANGDGFNLSMFRRIYQEYTGKRMKTDKEKRAFSSFVAMCGVDV